MRLSEKEKEAAGDERKRIEVERAQIEHTNNVRNWALADWEPRQRRLLPPVEKLDHRIREAERISDQWKHIFLQYSNQTRGAIASGRALNFFLDLCGSAALNQQSYREQLREELLYLETKKEQLRGVFLSGTAAEQEDAKRELDRLDNLREELELKQDILSRLSGAKALTRDHRQKIQFQRGLLGGKIVSNQRDGALPLNWPSLLVTDAAYEPFRQAVELAKEQAVADLRNGKRVRPETQRLLFNAADTIHSTFERYRKAYFQRKETHTSSTNDQFFEADRFIKSLRVGIVRFVAASDISDVEPDREFEGETIDELLAYMSNQGLRFAPPDRNSEYVYEVIYRQLVSYYSQLYSLQRAVEYDEQNVAELRQREGKLFHEQYRSTMDDLENALKARPPRDLAEQFVDFARGIKYLSDTRQ